MTLSTTTAKQHRLLTTSVFMHVGEFMLARYREVVETVLRFRESKERLIRRAVISLLPRLAAFAPERFAATYLKQCTNYLLSVLKFPSERGVGELSSCTVIVTHASGQRLCRKESLWCLLLSGFWPLLLT